MPVGGTPAPLAQESLLCKNLKLSNVIKECVRKVGIFAGFLQARPPTTLIKAVRVKCNSHKHWKLVMGDVIVNPSHGAPRDTPDYLWKFFVNRVRDQLHFVLCFSPVGDKFRPAPHMGELLIEFLFASKSLCSFKFASFFILFPVEKNRIFPVNIK